MRSRISNKNIFRYAGLLAIFFYVLYEIHQCLDFFFHFPDHSITLGKFSVVIPFSVISLFVFIAFYHLMFGRFYTVDIDSDNLYYHMYFFEKKRIALKDIVSAEPGLLPKKLFFFKAYGITVKYKHSTGQIRKFKFLSEAVWWGVNAQDINGLKELRRIISENREIASL